ncbi:hypothetical protein [Roseateles sp. MS654]|uniref:hypothetical protein n=1 Tax=Roseateles sp. MS654 TaxID=3412685 RepID=UPI003C2BBC00
MQQERHRSRNSQLTGAWRLAWQATLVALVLALSAGASAADRLVADLNRLLKSHGPDAVNARLSEYWETQSAHLGELTERCDVEAMTLSLALLQTTNLEALAGHHYSLQVAMGRCPGTLLPMMPYDRVQELCSVDAYIEANPEKDPHKEVARRLANLRRLGLAAISAKGKACVAAYERQSRDVTK